MSGLKIEGPLYTQCIYADFSRLIPRHLYGKVLVQYYSLSGIQQGLRPVFRTRWYIARCQPSIYLHHGTPRPVHRYTWRE